MRLPVLIVAVLNMLFGVINSVVPGIDYQKHPIIAVGLPKSGTSSLAEFLNAANPRIHSDHQLLPCPKPNYLFPLPAVTVENGVVWAAIHDSQVIHNICENALFIQRAIADNKPPFHYLLLNTTRNAFVQIDHDANLNWGIVLPQLDAMNMILDAYPDGLYIHHIRNASAHASSIMRWGSMSQRLKGALRRYPQIDSKASLEKQFEQWILLVREETRMKFLLRPLVRYLEVDVDDDPDAAAKISIFVGATRFKGMPHINTNTKNPSHPKKSEAIE